MDLSKNKLEGRGGVGKEVLDGWIREFQKSPSENKLGMEDS